MLYISNFTTWITNRALHNDDTRYIVLYDWYIYEMLSTDLQCNWLVWWCQHLHHLQKIQYFWLMKTKAWGKYCGSLGLRPWTFLKGRLVSQMFEWPFWFFHQLRWSWSSYWSLVSKGLLWMKLYFMRSEDLDHLIRCVLVDMEVSFSIKVFCH